MSKFASFWTYDIETYPNWFSAVFVNMATKQRLIFEISPRYDHATELWEFLFWCQRENQTFVGYNNLHFDWPVLQHFMNICYDGKRPTAMDTYIKAQAVIDAPRNDRTHVVWESDMYVRQIDVFKISHFNRFGSSVSLKQLEVARRAVNVSDLPLKPGLPVPPELYDIMISYNCDDVSETMDYAIDIWDRIEFRMQLDESLGGRRSRLNWNDVRIGSEYLLDELRKKGVQTHMGKNPIQTLRLGGIKLADILLPIEFDAPELQEIYEFFKSATVSANDIKGFFSNLSATVDGFKMDFGAGGLHGAVPKSTFRQTETRIVQLRDVESYYPRICAVNGWHPQHLGPTFVELFDQLFWKRKEHKKGTNENALFKLALNGSFGKMSDKYSALKDPQVLLSITVNGQLLLARLTEVLMRIPSLTMIQVNTDGVAYICDKEDEAHADAICKWWEDWTGLRLEADDWKLFAQRDVNNYCAIDLDGDVKQKGAYSVKRQPAQDHSSLIIQKAVEAYLMHGTSLEQTIYRDATDAFDFMLAVKVPKSSRVTWGGVPTQNVCRYYISIGGERLMKIMPPTPGETDEREIGISVGWDVELCNQAMDFDWHKLNRRYYLIEAQKLLTGLGL